MNLDAKKPYKLAIKNVLMLTLRKKNRTNLANWFGIAT